jgi:RecA-family ATPase
MPFEEKATVLNPTVGADGGQPFSQNINQSIADDSAESNENFGFDEVARQMRQYNSPGYMRTISMNELYENVYDSRPPIVDGLLYSGTYLFVGAPKVGKSFFMAQLAYHVSMGIKLWDYEVKKGTVLYLALEDTEKRLQERLFCQWQDKNAQKG